MILAGPPSDVPVLPDAVARLAAGAPVRAVWLNELGGLTFRLGAHGERYVKWVPAGSGQDLAVEAARLRWAVAFTRVPRVLELDADEDGGWLVTEGLDGENAVAQRWLAEPRAAVLAVGEGLRAFHDALPVSECQFRWHSPGERVAQRPAVDRLVVCHGDACVPNTLITGDGRWSGHVDLSGLGIGDRWAELAIATWSTRWNYGPGWEELLLAAYGVAEDPERTRYYRRLWGDPPPPRDQR